MLTRNSQIGEFYVMSPPQVPPQDGGLYTCDIMIFDEERDTHVRVSWNEAVKATLCTAESFDDKGELANLSVPRATPKRSLCTAPAPIPRSP